MYLSIYALLALFIQNVTSNLIKSNRLQLTALISDHNGRAKFQCWEIAKPFSTYPTVGEAIPGLADVSNISYVVLPPRSEEGLHNPPHPMFFVLLSGLAHVTLPDPENDDELWIMEGVNGLMIAADVGGEGHFTAYPSDKPSVALQIPFAGRVVMEHEVVGEGSCEVRNVVGCGEVFGGGWMVRQG